MCYSLINPCEYWTSATLSVLVSNGNTVYNVMGVKRHMPVDLPESETISGAEINLTVYAVSSGVLVAIWLRANLCRRCAFQSIVMK